MMNKILYLVFLLMFISCVKNSDDKYHETLVKSLMKLDEDFHVENDQYILIIPFDGCSTCFDESISLIPLIKSKSGLIIFSELHKKRVNNLLNEMGIGSSSIICDTMRLMITNKIVGVNPIFIKMNDEKIIYKNTVEYNNMENIHQQIND